MSDKPDRTLLEEYARNRSSTAIDTLVRRHANWVYATCLREVRDPQLAEDVAQSVFLILLRKAAKMRSRQKLTGWLFNTCRYASANALRMERRRTHHECKAVQKPVQNQIKDVEDADELQHASSLLNNGISRLNTIDREVILIRFFREGSNNDVATILGISESAARVRVSRSLQRLRDILSRDVKGLSEASLTTALTLTSIAPAGIRGSLASVVANPSTAGARTISITKGAIKMIAMAKTKMVAGIMIITVLAAGGVAVVAQLAESPGPSTTQQIQPTGDLPNGLVKGVINRQIALSQDTMILKYLPDWSHGEVDNIAAADNDGGVRALFEWPAIKPADLSNPMTKVYLALYSRNTTSQPNAGKLCVFEILNDWKETTSSWAQQPKTAEKPVTVEDFSNGEGWKLFEVTPLIRTQINEKKSCHGVMLRFLQENRSGRAKNWSGYEFVSREGIDKFQSLRPRLVIATDDGL